MIKVKICGITNLEDAEAAVDAGCNGLGFVFYKKSPRYIAPKTASQIIRELPSNIKKVGVFVNAKDKTIRQIARLCNLDFLQFHGNESVEFCNKFKGYKIIKAFRINPVRNTKYLGKKNKISNGVKNRIDLKKILKYRTFAYLFDTFLNSKIGGTGESFNWKLLEKIDKIRRPIFLSGGLNRENVQAAIKAIHPDWVDVSSSVEIKPGKKDYTKIKEFIGAVKK